MYLIFSYLITPEVDAYKDINVDTNLPMLTMNNIINYLDRLIKNTLNLRLKTEYLFLSLGLM